MIGDVVADDRAADASDHRADRSADHGAAHCACDRAADLALFGRRRGAADAHEQDRAGHYRDSIHQGLQQEKIRAPLGDQNPAALRLVPTPSTKDRPLRAISRCRGSAASASRCRRRR